MRCGLVLYAAALFGLSTAGWQQYGVGGYSGQQMPVSYYLPVPSNMYTGHQQMYVPGHQQVVCTWPPAGVCTWPPADVCTWPPADVCTTVSSATGCCSISCQADTSTSS